MHVFTNEDYVKISNWLKANAVKDSDLQEVNTLSLEDIFTVVNNENNKKINIDSFLKFIIEYFKENKTFDDEIDVEWKVRRNLNAFVNAGIYNISGIRVSENDNMPISNVGDNASISAKLFVTESPEGATTYRSIIGQTLLLSNAEGHETKIYTRSANKTSKDGGATYEVTWGDWQVCQGMKEVGLVDSYDSFIDNGMYSGIYNNNGIIETFVIITINDYVVKNQFSQPKSISQLKYALNAHTNKSELSIRVGGGEPFAWGEWSNIFDGGNLISCTYTELKTLKDNKELIPGSKYRITDYVTTTSQADTKSANHQFDIIVEALTEDTLSEDAKVCLHDGDTYFSNNDLNAWEIKYCFENDTNRFTWASITDGKGVIYYLKDEFNNEAWYDFKNIQFLRTASWFKENPNFPTQFTENKYFYTFSAVNNNVITDDSLYSTNYHATDNHLGRNTSKITKLNNTIFIDKVNNGVFNNIIADGHGNNTFGQSVWNNRIGHNFSNNIIYTSFQYNNVSSNFANNKVKDNFVYNEIGAGFTYNELNGKVMRTIFKPIFSGNTVNGSLTYCTFGSNNNYVTDFPSMTNVTISNGCFNGTNDSKINLNNLLTSNGWNLLTTINGFNTEIEYTILYCDNNRYDIFSHDVFDKISNIYDLGSFETSGDAEVAARNPNISANTNYSMLKYYVPSLNKTGIIEQIVGQSSTRQIITWDGARKVRTLKFLNIGGNISLTNFTEWEELKILTITEWNSNFTDINNKIKEVKENLITPIYSNPNLDFESTTNNSNCYGYVGTLKNINVNGDLLLIDSIGVYVREGQASPNLDTPVWCRLLKSVNGVWEVVYQSTESKTINGIAPETLFSFKMKAVDEQNKLIKSTDKIAIVYVNAEDAPVISSVLLGFKSISVSGGLSNQIANDSTGVSNWAPAFVIGYLSMANTPINAVTIENAQTITGTKQFNNGLSISGKSFITSDIDSGELKVFPQGDNTTKGFIIRSANRGDTIPTVELLATNNQTSYTYRFPKKDGTVAMLNDIVNSLTSTETNKALSANQGKLLNDNKQDKLQTYTEQSRDYALITIPSTDEENNNASVKVTKTTASMFSTDNLASISTGPSGTQLIYSKRDESNNIVHDDRISIGKHNEDNPHTGTHITLTSKSINEVDGEKVTQTSSMQVTPEGISMSSPEVSIDATSNITLRTEDAEGNSAYIDMRGGEKPELNIYTDSELTIYGTDSVSVSSDNNIEFSANSSMSIKATDAISMQSGEDVIEDVVKEINEKAPKVGYAPELKVDFAKELVGRGEATPEVIGGIRPTGVRSIGDGNATIERIKGNSVVWNQRIKWSVTNASAFGLKFSSPEPGCVYIEGVYDRASVASVQLTFTKAIIPTGHKVLCMSDSTWPKVRLQGSGNSASGISVGNGSLQYDLVLTLSFSEGEEVNMDIHPVIHDLTLMFGAGNEPTTIEDFEARKPLGVTNEYNEGTIVSYNGEALKSVGFNAWDEEWKVGFLNPDGTVTSGDRIMPKNPIKVIPGQTYITTKTLYYAVYDENMAVIGERLQWLPSKPQEMPSNAAYIIFITDYDYTNIYKNNICIHLAHSYNPEKYPNGYAPYEDDVHPLPDISAIKDANGNQLFPNGLLSAGSVHDEITATKAIKRVGVVDMGTRSWYSNTTSVFTAKILTMDKSTSNILLIPYEYKGLYISNIESKGCVVNGNIIIIKDPSYTDVTTFKQAMSGVLLYYELAEPIEVDLPEPLNMTYEAWDFGTEELLYKGATTPLNADIVYQFNAVDRIRENSTKNTELEARIAALEAMITQLTTQTTNEGGASNEQM